MKTMSKTLSAAVAVMAMIWAVSAGEMKLMSFNVCHCSGMDDKIDIVRTAGRIKAEDPDFACLQELDWCTARANGIDQPAELARLTGMHATFAKAIFFQGGQYGVMLLSREKPTNVVQVPLPGAEPRVLLLCEFSDCVVGTTHLSVAVESERTASIELIRKAVSSFVGKKPVFLTGDWNSLSDSTVLKGLGGFLKIVSDVKCQTFHGRFENGPDGQPLDMSKFCIDYIACDAAHAGSFKVLDAHVVDDRKTSDHAPIVVTLETPDAAQPRPALVPVPMKLTMCEGIRRVKAGKVTEEIITKRMTDATLPKEGYRLEINTDVIAVVSSDDAGFFYALQTLKQLAFFSYGRLAFPCCTIEDAPQFGWRGVHWDDSRHFFGKSAVKRTLDLMAQHKLNVFHWHLTDDEGWRLPVHQYPKLTTVGAMRPYSKNHKNLADRFEDGIYGPFSYVCEDIADVVAYARERHIRVVPEVDVPGHCAALLKAYPEYGCFADCPEKAPQGAVDNVICLGNDKSLEMVFAIFDELVAMFPDELVHIGGDEVNKVNYRACPKCQARMKTHGLKTENDLQAWFARELGKHLAKRGKRVLGWDELILDGEPPANMVAMSWRGAEGGRAAAKAGLDAVMCPHFYCYFDYTQCLSDDPAVYPWFTERLPLEKAYAYDPLEGIPSEQQKYILGGQCCNWAEYTCNETELQWKMWPRACATAEVFWSPADKRDFGDFSQRMTIHRPCLLAQGINCAPLPAAASMRKSETKPVKTAVSFARGAWNPADWIILKSPRWNYRHGFAQFEGYIANETPGEKVVDWYSAMAHVEPLAVGNAVTVRMSFDHKWAPGVFIAPDLADGASGKELRDHYEIILFEGGLNVWRYKYVDGRFVITKPAFLEASFPDGEVLDLTVTIESKNVIGGGKTRQMTVRCGDHVLGFRSDDIPERYFVGINANEGRCRFYSFETR